MIRARAERPRLRWRDRKLLVISLLVVALVRTGLVVGTYRQVLRFMPHGANEAAPDAFLARVGWAVARTARLVPRATCLTQALAAQFLLAMKGYRSAIRIGVVGSGGGGLDAHAWLISGDRIVIGAANHDLARYATIADLGPPA